MVDLKSIISFRKRNWNRIIAATHIIAVLALSLAIQFLVNGYKALDSQTPRHGRHILKANEVIAIISVCTSATTVLCAMRAATIAWTCTTSLMQKGKGLDINQFNWMAGYQLPRAIPTRQTWIALLALSLLPGQQLVSWMPPASINWDPSSSFSGTTTIQSRDPTEIFPHYGAYSFAAPLRQEIVEKAVGMTSLAWKGEGSQNARTCRHVVNENHIPVGSVVHGATIPCIVIHSISWPTAEPSGVILEVMKSLSLLSITNQGVIGPLQQGDTPGLTYLFDSSNTTLKVPASSSFPTLDPLSAELGAVTSVYPDPFSYSGNMTAIVFARSDGLDPFGLPYLNNNFTTSSARLARNNLLYTYLTVEFTVGVMTPAKSTFIASNVIESVDQYPSAKDIVPGPWVKEALYMITDTMALIATMNNTGIQSWNNLFDYTERMIRYCFIGCWDALHRTFEPNNVDLEVSLAEPRLVARVQLYFIYIWLGVNLLMVVAGILARSQRSQNLPNEGLVGAMLMDASSLRKDCENNYPLPEGHDWFELSWYKNGEEAVRGEGSEEKETGKGGETIYRNTKVTSDKSKGSILLKYS